MTVTKKLDVPADKYRVTADSRAGVVTIYDKQGHVLIFEQERRLTDYVNYLSNISSRKCKPYSYEPDRHTEGVRGSATVLDTEAIHLIEILRKAQDVVKRRVLEEVL